MALPFHDDVEWDRDETHQLYRNRGVLLSNPCRRPGPEVKLDPIAPELVGCANLAKILESRSRVIGAWGSAVDALAGRGILVGERELDGPQLEREAALYVSTSDAFCRRFLAELTTQSGLLVPHAGYPTIMHCGMFGVEKTEVLLRVILKIARFAQKLHKRVSQKRLQKSSAPRSGIVDSPQSRRFAVKSHVEHLFATRKRLKPPGRRSSTACVPAGASRERVTRRVSRNVRERTTATTMPASKGQPFSKGCAARRRHWVWAG